MAEAGARSGLVAAFGALQVRDYRLLWLNAVTFFIGGGMRVVAMSWLVLDLTDSPAFVGAVLFAQGAPMAVLLLPAGVWADRADRRVLLIVSQLVSAAATAALAVLILAGVVAVWHVLVIAILLGAAMAVGQPARQALVPALVGPERLMNAIVLNNMIQNLSFVIGPAVAGGLLATIGTGGTFVAQAVLLLAGLPWLLALRSPPVRQAAARVSGLADVREGIAHVTESAFLRSLFVVTAFTGIFYMGSQQALLPVFARDVLDSGEVGLGALSATFGLGMLAGSLLIASRGDFERKGDVLLWSLLIGAGVFFTFAMSRWLPLSLAMMAAWGFGAAFFMNLTVTLIQSHTPDALMGRVMSVQALCFFGVSPIGNLESGAVAQTLGAPAAATVGAGAVALMCLYFFLYQPKLRAAT